MKIYVVAGAGQGHTELSAFDAALQNSGVANYNLLQLSSIIPPGATVIEAKKYVSHPSTYGHKLYVVKAEMRSSMVGRYIGAGIGWYQLEDGRGMFVEHEEEGRSEAEVEAKLENLIQSSLQDLCVHRGLEYCMDKARKHVLVSKVDPLPTCVLVVATFETASWKS